MKATLNYPSALEQKELGLYATALNNQDFVILARRIAREISDLCGSVCMDDIRTHPALQGHQPSSSHTWGSILQGPGWRLIGYEPSKLRTNHTRRIGRWRWKP